MKTSNGKHMAIAALNCLLIKYKQPLCNKETVLNRANEAFNNGASPAKGYSIGMKYAQFLIKNGVQQ